MGKVETKNNRTVNDDMVFECLGTAFRYTLRDKESKLYLTYNPVKKVFDLDESIERAVKVANIMAVEMVKKSFEEKYEKGGYKEKIDLEIIPIELTYTKTTLEAINAHETIENIAMYRNAEKTDEWKKVDGISQFLS